MTDIAIRVENPSKLYHIGQRRERHDTLVSAVRGRCSDCGLQSAIRN